MQTDLVANICAFSNPARLSAILFLAGISVGATAGFAQTTAAQQNPVTAIDILLEPDTTMLQRAEAANARLLKIFPKGYSLDASHRPHITIVQRFVRTVCYCEDCQKAADQIEALPNAGAIRDPDGGTAYILYRKDRFACSKGAELLKSYKLNETSVTNRMVATCCNSAMFLKFDRGPHWVSAYRARFRGDLPPLEARICTKSKPRDTVLLNDVPSYPRYAPGLAVKLLASRVAMMLGL